MNESKLHGAYLYKGDLLYGRISAWPNRVLFICTNDTSLCGTRIEDRFGYEYSYSFYPIRYAERDYIERRFEVKVVLSEHITLYDLI